MVDTAKLGKWIKPQHLDEGNLTQYREAFDRHPAKLVVVQDFLLDDVAERISRFLAEEALFEKEHGLYSIEGPVPEEQWQSADEDDRLFRLSRLKGISPEKMMSPNAMTYLRLRQSLQQAEFRGFFEALTGLEFGSSDDFGVHSMSVGDFLRAHSDDLRNRSIALVMYLSPGWQPSYGGALHMVDETGGDSTIEATFNSIVVFDVQAENEHLVAPIEAAAGDARRLTIGGWYPTPA
jgi:2OG-Fe(II) oxygenase superfamily